MIPEGSYRLVLEVFLIVFRKKINRFKLTGSVRIYSNKTVLILEINQTAIARQTYLNTFSLNSAITRALSSVVSAKHVPDSMESEWVLSRVHDLKEWTKKKQNNWSKKLFHIIITAENYHVMICEDVKSLV